MCLMCSDLKKSQCVSAAANALANSTVSTTVFSMFDVFDVFDVFGSENISMRVGCCQCPCKPYGCFSTTVLDVLICFYSSV